MKKSTILFLICIITMPSIGQDIKDYIHKTGNEILAKKKSHKGEVNKFKLISQYNRSTKILKQQIDSTIYEGYDTNDNQWYYEYKEVFSYDTSWNLTLSTEYYWHDSNNQWEIGYKEEFTYNSSNIINSITEYYWDDNTNQWGSNYKIEYNFNADNTISVIFEYNWSESLGVWESEDKKEYSYDVYGKLILISDYSWDENNSIWINDRLVEFEYNANSYLIIIIKSFWDDTNIIWQSYDKEEYTYDSNNNVISVINYYWDENIGLWLPSWEGNYTYDVNNNPILEIYSEWDGTNTLWYLDSKYEYNYDLAYSSTEIILPPYYYFVPDFSEEISNLPLNYINYDYTDTTWVINEKGTYYSSEQDVIGISDINANPINVYPNPATNIISIDIDNNYKQLSFELIDIVGKTVITQKVSGLNNINISELPTGLYFYRLTDKSEVIQIGKIVIN